MGYYISVPSRSQWQFPQLGFTLVSRFNRSKEELAEGIRVQLDDRFTLDRKVVMVAAPEFLKFIEQHGFPVQASQFVQSDGDDSSSYYVAPAPKSETDYPQDIAYAAERILTAYLTDTGLVLPDEIPRELASLSGWLWSGLSSGVRLQALVKVLGWNEEMFPTRFMRDPGASAEVDEFILQNGWIQR